jgi:hypothetical protein
MSASESNLQAKRIGIWGWAGLIMYSAIFCAIFALLIMGFIRQCQTSLINTYEGKTLVVMHSVTAAISQYFNEYNSFPGSPAAEPRDVELRSQGPILAALFGNNERKIKFVDLPLAREGKFGVIETPDGRTLVDMWGEPYFILLDCDFDNLLANPEIGADAKYLKKNQPPARLTNMALMYSAGPDRDPKTWQDNVRTW